MCWLELRVFDQEGQCIRLDKGKVINLRSLSQNTGFNTLVMTLGDGANLLRGWLLEAWGNQWPVLSEDELPDIALAENRKCVYGLREVGWLCKAKRCTRWLCAMGRPRGYTMYQSCKECC